jgi:hypothetical protein
MKTSPLRRIVGGFVAEVKASAQNVPDMRRVARVGVSGVGQVHRTLHRVQGARPTKIGLHPTTAVCLLTGTELAFSKEVAVATAGMSGGELCIAQTLAIFRQINKEQPRTHHDALEFPDGRIVLLTMLRDGQEATVLQLPVQPTTAAEEEAQKRVVYAG